MFRVAARPLVIHSASILGASPYVALTATARRSLFTSPYARKPAPSSAGDVSGSTVPKHDVTNPPFEPSKPTTLRTPIGTSIEAPHHRDSVRVSAVVPTHGHGQLEPLNVMMHPVYTSEENHSVQVLHRAPTNGADKTAILLGKILRWGFDFVSRYKHKPIPEGSTLSLEELRAQGYTMNDSQWLARILFLESVAGVPGMVGACLRHLRSLRLMQRDNAWINTLLQEAENERMHLMSFMMLKNPSIFFRALILGAQGVFWNMFFMAYLVSPKTCHRFVGVLEEEAVYTYTNLIKDIEAGRLPEWENVPAPEIAIEYWRLPKDAKLLEMIYAVRSDESTHRFVNHSLASLEPQDVNPFAMGEPSMTMKGTKVGFERAEAMEFISKNQEVFSEARERAEGQQQLPSSPSPVP